MEENTRIVLGLDIGIASCGWALIDFGNDRVIDAGVHLWEAPQESKTKASLAATRRGYRSTRRNIARTADRKKYCRALFAEYGLMPQDADAAWLQTVKGDIQPLEARAKGLDELLSDRQFAQALYQICSRRGYIPHGEGSDSVDSEGKKVLRSISENEKAMRTGGFRTVGEYLHSLDASRNKAGKYDLCIANVQLVDEVKVLFGMQRKFGNPKASSEFEKAYIECMVWQKDSSSRDEEVYKQVGSCIYFGNDENLADEEKKRAARACPSFEQCAALERICHAVVVMPGGREEKLPGDVKSWIFRTLFSPASLKGNKDCKVTYAALRKRMDLPADAYFKAVEFGEESKREIAEPKAWRLLRKNLSEGLMGRLAADIDLADAVASALAFASSEGSLREKLEGLGFAEDDLEELASLPYSSKVFKGYGTRSLKALGMLVDSFMSFDEVTTLAEAEAACGLDKKRQEQKGEKGFLPPYMEYDPTCKNPVVLRVMGRVRKIVNAVVRTYGMPSEVHIELARELKHSEKEKKAIVKANKRNAEMRKGALKTLSELCGCDEDEVSGALLKKYELWLEQEGVDLYSGDPIALDKLVENEKAFEVDHILPYSRTCDDSRANKVLVAGKSNQEKGQRSPFEWLGATAAWDDFERRIVSATHSKLGRKKAANLLQKDLSGKQEEFIKRNLNDTRYASRAALGYIERYLGLPDDDGRHVFAVAGGATSALRHAWGFSRKDREADECHHAVDAAIIAGCTSSIVMKVAKASEAKRAVPKEQRKALFAGAEPWEGFATDIDKLAGQIIPTRKVDADVSHGLYQDFIYSYKGMTESGSHALLGKSGKVSKFSNYVLREDGSAVLPDEMAFLRLWWDADAGRYLPEPVYYSDIDAIRKGVYIPRTMHGSNGPRDRWRPIPQNAMSALPLVLRRGDMVSCKGRLLRYKRIDISNCSMKLVDPRGKLSDGEEVTGYSLGSIRQREDLRKINEDILGLCYKC